MAPKSLLIGNGINRITSDGNNHFPSWNELLLFPLKEKRYYDKYVDVETMGYPLKFEYVVNFINRNEPQRTKVYTNVKSSIVRKLNEYTSKIHLDDDVIDALKRINVSSILTTNYDKNIEEAICAGNLIRNDTKFSAREGAYFDKTSSSPEGISFYHIHGIVDDTKSICLGYEHYMRIVRTLMNKIVGDKERKSLVLDILEKKPKELLDKYEMKFFTDDIYVLGLGLSEDEVDLWWILCYRAYLFFTDRFKSKSLIKNKIVYYDIHKTKITSDGYSYEADYQKKQKAIFESMHVEYVSKEITGNRNFKDLYLEALEEIKNK